MHGQPIKLTRDCPVIEIPSGIHHTLTAGSVVRIMQSLGGSYTVTLTVTDNAAATSMQAQSVTVVPPNMHVGDLDGASTTQQNAWTATVTVTIHTSSHGLLANAAVSGAWNDGGTSSCTTNADIRLNDSNLRASSNASLARSCAR